MTRIRINSFPEKNAMIRIKALLAGITFGLAAAASAAPEVYTIQSSHTFPSFEFSHRGMSRWRGKFNKTTGKIWLDRDKQTGKVDITVDTSTINFGLPIMDQRAQNEEWFDVKKYPTATYKSDSILFKDGVPAAVNGQLTLRGITKPLRLDIFEFTCRQSPMLKREVCGADLRAELDRRDFGMTEDIVNNDGMVRLQVQVEAAQGDNEPQIGAPPDAPPGRPAPNGPSR